MRLSSSRETVVADPEVGMEWWGWLLVVLAVLAVLALAFVAVQARRRRGGVITKAGG